MGDMPIHSPMSRMPGACSDKDTCLRAGFGHRASTRIASDGQGHCSLGDRGLTGKDIADPLPNGLREHRFHSHRHHLPPTSLRSQVALH